MGQVTIADQGGRGIGSITQFRLGAAGLVLVQLLASFSGMAPAAGERGGEERQEGDFWPGFWLFGDDGRPALHLSGGTEAEVVEAMIDLLEVDEPGLRRSAARILGNLGENAHSAVPALLFARSDEDAKVRASVEQALDSIWSAWRSENPDQLEAWRHSGTDGLVTVHGTVVGFGDRTTAETKIVPIDIEAAYSVAIEVDRWFGRPRGRALGSPRGGVLSLGIHSPARFAVRYFGSVAVDHREIEGRPVVVELRPRPEGPWELIDLHVLSFFEIPPTE